MLKMAMVIGCLLGGLTSYMIVIVIGADEGRGNALQSAEYHHRRQRRRGAAGRRGKQEQQGRADEQFARSDPVGEPAGERRGDGGG